MLQWNVRAFDFVIDKSYTIALGWRGKNENFDSVFDAILLQLICIDDVVFFEIRFWENLHVFFVEFFTYIILIEISHKQSNFVSFFSV